MITIGVTGGIGSGKSTVCHMLEELGARVFHADPEARRIMETNRTVRGELIALLGADVYRADGSLDRALVAGRMFGDDEQVRAVNGIVHPRVRAAFRRAKRKARADGVRVFVKEAALLLESGTRGLDLVVVVTADKSARIDRVSRRDEIGAEAVTARMRHQRSTADFLAAADHVIVNDGTLDDLNIKVRGLWQTLSKSGRF